MKLLNIYTRSNCTACMEAKIFLHNYEIPFNEINVDVDQSGLDFLYKNNDKYLPQFYVEDKKFMPGGWNTVRTMRKHEIFNMLK